MVKQMRQAGPQRQPDGTIVTTQQMSMARGNEMIIEARIEAQKRRGVDGWHQRVISKVEADKLMQMPDTKSMTEKEITTKIKEAGARAEQWYGAYGARAFKDAVDLTIKDQVGKDAASSLIVKMARGDRISASDMARYRGAVEAETPLQTMFPSSPAEFLPGIPGIGANVFQQGRQQIGTAAKAAGAAASAKPSPKHNSWLMEDPKGRAAAFDAKFGAGAAARVLAEK